MHYITNPKGEGPYASQCGKTVPASEATRFLSEVNCTDCLTRVICTGKDAERQLKEIQKCCT